MPPCLTLKVDVDTLRGTREGALRLIKVLERQRCNATFLFSVGPDHTGRALRRVFQAGFVGKAVHPAQQQIGFSGGLGHPLIRMDRRYGAMGVKLRRWILRERTAVLVDVNSGKTDGKNGKIWCGDCVFNAYGIRSD